MDAFPIPDSAIREYYASMGWSNDYVMVDPGPVAKPKAHLALHHNHFSYFGAGKAVDEALKEAALDRLLFDGEGEGDARAGGRNDDDDGDDDGDGQSHPEGDLAPEVAAAARSAYVDRATLVRRGMLEISKLMAKEAENHAGDKTIGGSLLGRMRSTVLDDEAELRAESGGGSWPSTGVSWRRCRRFSLTCFRFMPLPHRLV